MIFTRLAGTAHLSPTCRPPYFRGKAERNAYRQTVTPRLRSAPRDYACMWSASVAATHADVRAIYSAVATCKCLSARVSIRAIRKATEKVLTTTYQVQYCRCCLPLIYTYGITSPEIGGLIRQRSAENRHFVLPGTVQILPDVTRYNIALASIVHCRRS